MSEHKRPFGLIHTRGRESKIKKKKNQQVMTRRNQAKRAPHVKEDDLLKIEQFHRME